MTTKTSQAQSTAIRACTNCGMQLPPQATFCGKCGQRVSQDEAPASSLWKFEQAYRVTSLVRQRPFLQLSLAIDLEHHCPVVVRDIDVSHLDEASRAIVLTALEQEHNLLRRLTIPHLMPQIALHETQDHFYSISTWAISKHGKTHPRRLTTLHDLLQSGLGLPEESITVAWTIQLASALEALHQQGIVVGELDPSVVVVSTPDYSGQPALMISWLPATPALHPVNGTPAGILPSSFTAPEVLQGQSTGRSDIYSLGAMLYLLLTGTAPSVPPTRAGQRARPLKPARSLNPHLNSALNTVVMKALAVTPEYRFQHVSEMISALRSLDAPTPHPTTSSFTIPSRKTRQLAKEAQPTKKEPEAVKLVTSTEARDTTTEQIDTHNTITPEVSAPSANKALKKPGKARPNAEIPRRTTSEKPKLTGNYLSRLKTQLQKTPEQLRMDAEQPVALTDQATGELPVITTTVPETPFEEIVAEVENIQNGVAAPLAEQQNSDPSTLPEHTDDARVLLAEQDTGPQPVYTAAAQTVVDTPPTTADRDHEHQAAETTADRDHEHQAAETTVDRDHEHQVADRPVDEPQPAIQPVATFVEPASSEQDQEPHTETTTPPGALINTTALASEKQQTITADRSENSQETSTVVTDITEPQESASTTDQPALTWWLQDSQEEPSETTETQYEPSNISTVADQPTRAMSVNDLQAASLAAGNPVVQDQEPATTPSQGPDQPSAPAQTQESTPVAPSEPPAPLTIPQPFSTAIGDQPAAPSPAVAQQALPEFADQPTGGVSIAEMRELLALPERIDDTQQVMEGQEQSERNELGDDTKGLQQEESSDEPTIVMREAPKRERTARLVERQPEGSKDKTFDRLKGMVTGKLPAIQQLVQPKEPQHRTSSPTTTTPDTSPSLLKRVQHFVLGEQQHHTTAAALIETPLRIQPNQAYTIRIHIMGRDRVKSTNDGTGLSSLTSGNTVHIEVRSALYQNYAYIVQQADVEVPGGGYAAEVTMPMHALSNGSTARRERLQIFFMDKEHQELYEKPFVLEVFISPLVKAGREGHSALAIPH